MNDEKLLSDVELIVKIFEDAEKEILKEIEGKNLWRDSDRVQMMKQIKGILVDLEKKSNSSAEPLISKYYNEATQQVDDIVGKSGVFQLIDKSAVEFVIASLPEIVSEHTTGVKNLLSGAYSQIESSLNIVKKELRQELISQVATSKIKGESRSKLVKKLELKLRERLEKGVTGFIVPTKTGVMNLSVKAYIHGLTQQTLITSSQSATIKRASELDQDLVRISTHANPSRMCANWAGQIVSITGKTQGYKTLKQATFNGKYKRGGIGHRYCRHSLTVYIESKVKFNT
jgi:Phage minor capsid protein 2